MILATRAYPLTDLSTASFSIIATDSDFTYVFPSNEQMFDSDKRFEDVMETLNIDDTSSLTASDYLEYGQIGLSFYSFSTPIEYESLELATQTELSALATYQEVAQISASQLEGMVLSNNLSDVALDFPDVLDYLTSGLDEDSGDSTNEDSSTLPDGVKEYIVTALGGVYEDGPNAWLLNDDSQSSPDGSGIVFNEQPPQN